MAFAPVGHRHAVAVPEAAHQMGGGLPSAEIGYGGKHLARIAQQPLHLGKSPFEDCCSDALSVCGSIVALNRPPRTSERRGDVGDVDCFECVRVDEGGDSLRSRHVDHRAYGRGSADKPPWRNKNRPLPSCRVLEAPVQRFDGGDTRPDDVLFDACDRRLGVFAEERLVVYRDEREILWTDESAVGGAA